MANSGLSRTAVDGNRQTFTHSFWVKRSKVGAESCLFYSRINSNNHFLIRFTGSDQLELVNRVSGNNNYFVTTNRKFRDVSAWYHILVQVDTTQSTSGDRIKFYVNGVQETSFATQTIGSQNDDLSTNYNTATLYFGQEYTSGSNFFEGYMSHVALVDGAVSAPTVFGETDSTSGIWKFKSPTGVTWGNNGVHLKFENSGNLGLDSSGETHNYTVNGDLKQALDTPSNVHATWNPLLPDAQTLSNGNNTFTNGSGANWRVTGSTLGASSGKWYCEIKITELGGGSQVGVMNLNQLPASLATDLGSAAWSWSYYHTGNKRHSNSSTSYGASYTTGDIIGIAMDLDNNKLYFHKNGTYQDSGDPTSGSTGTGSAFDLDAGGVYAFGTCSNDAGTNPIQDVNFGNGFFGTTAITSAGSNGNGSLFEYNVPSGYYALNTKNINTYG